MPQIAGTWRISIDWTGVDSGRILRVMLNDTTSLLGDITNSSATPVTYSADIAGITIRPGDRIAVWTYIPTDAYDDAEYSNLRISYAPAAWPNKVSDTRFTVGTALSQPSSGSTTTIGTVSIHDRRIYPAYVYVMGKYRVRVHYTNDAGASGTSTAKIYHNSRKFISTNGSSTWGNVNVGVMEIGTEQTLNEADGYCVFDDLHAMLGGQDWLSVDVVNAAGETIVVDNLEICFDVA